MNNKFYITRKKALMLGARTDLDNTRNIAIVVRIFLESLTLTF